LRRFVFSTGLANAVLYAKSVEEQHIATSSDTCVIVALSGHKLVGHRIKTPPPVVTERAESIRRGKHRHNRLASVNITQLERELTSPYVEIVGQGIVHKFAEAPYIVRWPRGFLCTDEMNCQKEGQGKQGFYLHLVYRSMSGM